MRRFPRGVRAQSLRAGGITWIVLALLGACSAPRQFGRSGTTPSQQGRSATQRGPAALHAIRPAPPPLPPIYADETADGAPWSGLGLAMQGSAQGILVGRVSRGSPADSAGIQPGDYIFQLDGRSVRDALEIMAEVGRVGVGGSLRLGVHRAERVRLFRVEPIAKPPALRVETTEREELPSATLEGELPGGREPPN